MGRDWRHIPALLAGAGVLAATLYVIELPATSEADGAQPPTASLMRMDRPAMPHGTRPSEALAFAVERTARGALPEPFFVDPQAAARFHDRWAGRLPEGKVLVARADDFDAGAEHGHRVPVTLWIDTGRRVMGLTGQVRFESLPGGLRLQEAELEPTELAVTTWAEAAVQLRRAHPGAGELHRGTAPFYGLFRFRLDGQRYAVDAVTGEVIAE